MLRKLFKYDFLAIGKTMWLLTLIVAVTTALGVVAEQFIFEVGEALDRIEATGPALANIALLMLLGALIFISFIAIVAYIVLSVIMITKRYYSNLFTDEGYLTFTLPVKTSSILDAKILSGLVWGAVAALVSVLCFWILIIGITGEDLRYMLESIYYSLTYAVEGIDLPTYHYILFAIEYVLTVVVGFIFGVLLLYFCITFASVIAKKARVILGIGIYAGVTSVLSTIVQIVTSILPFIFEEDMYMNDADIIGSFAGQMHFQLCFTLVVYASVAVVAYILNRYLLKNKLNLV